MSVVVTLPLTAPVLLPAAFLERWRELEATYNVPAQTLEAEEVLDAAGAGWWFVVRIGSRVVSSTCSESPTAAAEKTFDLWRAEMAKRATRPINKDWQDSGKGFRRLVDVTA